MKSEARRSPIPLMRPATGEEEIRQVKQVIESGWLAQGPKVREFEKKLENYFGAKHVVATSSCTMALNIALHSIGINQGIEVVSPDFTFPATANAAMVGGFSVGLVDVNLGSYSIDLEHLRKEARPTTKCVIPVHAFGHPLDLDELYETAESKALEVVEDAATAIGSKYKGIRVGSRGKAVCFSFHPRKLLTTGEGGCIATDDDSVFETAMSLRNHGQAQVHGVNKFQRNALNCRMSDIQAAVGLAQLEKIDRIIERRRQQSKLYEDLLKATNLPIRLQDESDWAYHTHQSYVIRFERHLSVNRDTLIQVLREKFLVETQIGTYSLILQPAFEKCRKLGRISNGPELYHYSLSLPLFDALTSEEQEYVVDSLVEVMRS